MIYGSTQVVKSFLGTGEQILTSSFNYNWIIRLTLNTLGYLTVLLPGFLIHKYVHHSKYLQREGKANLNYFIFVLLRKPCDYILFEINELVLFIKKIIILGKRCLPKLLHACFIGSGQSGGLLDSTHFTPQNYAHQQTFIQEILLLLYCFLGLQVSYLTWGYLQEKIMTQVNKI